MKTITLLAIMFTLAAPVARAEEKKPEKPVDVYTTQLKKQRIFEPTELYGFAKAKARKGVFAPFAGVVNKVLVEKGQTVREGEPLLWLAPHDTGYAYKTHVVQAPAAGIVISIADSGKKVDAAQELALMVKSDAYEVVVQASIDDLRNLRPNEILAARFESRSTGKSQISARVVNISPAVNIASNTVDVTFDLVCEPTCEGLREGAIVTITMERDPVMGYRLPYSYLHDQLTRLIYLKEGNIASWVDVKTGRNFGNEIEVFLDLAEGTTIVTGVSRTPKEGEVVTVKEP